MAPLKVAARVMEKRPSRCPVPGFPLRCCGARTCRFERRAILTDTSIQLRRHHVNDAQYVLGSRALERLTEPGYEGCVSPR